MTPAERIRKMEADAQAAVDALRCETGDDCLFTVDVSRESEGPDIGVAIRSCVGEREVELSEGEAIVLRDWLCALYGPPVGHLSLVAEARRLKGALSNLRSDVEQAIAHLHVGAMFLREPRTPGDAGQARAALEHAEAHLRKATGRAGS